MPFSPTVYMDKMMMLDFFPYFFLLFLWFRSNVELANSNHFFPFRTPTKCSHCYQAMHWMHQDYYLLPLSSNNDDDAYSKHCLLQFNDSTKIYCRRFPSSSFFLSERTLLFSFLDRFPSCFDCLYQSELSFKLVRQLSQMERRWSQMSATHLWPSNVRHKCNRIKWI